MLYFYTHWILMLHTLDKNSLDICIQCMTYIGYHYTHWIWLICVSHWMGDRLGCHTFKQFNERIHDSLEGMGLCRTFRGEAADSFRSTHWSVLYLVIGHGFAVWAIPVHFSEWWRGGGTNLFPSAMIGLLAGLLILFFNNKFLLLYQTTGCPTWGMEPMIIGSSAQHSTNEL